MIFRNRNVWYSFQCTQQALAQILLPILACLLLPSPPHWPLALPPKPNTCPIYIWPVYGLLTVAPSLPSLPAHRRHHRDSLLDPRSLCLACITPRRLYSRRGHHHGAMVASASCQFLASLRRTRLAPSALSDCLPAYLSVCIF